MNKSSSFFFACCFALAIVASANEKPHASSEKPQDSATITAAERNEITSYARLAQDAADHEKWPLADHFIELLTRVDAPATEKKATLCALAATYEKAHAWSKAIAIYEKIIELCAGDDDLPEMFLKVGLLYREAGLHQRAIARFYSVLNSSLKGNRGVDAGQALAHRAQTEIAESYFLAGDYAQAAKFYELLTRLQLTPGEQGQIQFKLLHCKFLLGDLENAVAAGKKFLAEFPNTASTPECRYLIASAQRSLQKPQEALDTVLALLRAEKAESATAPEKWRFWQQKTGNDFANDYYQRGDFNNALTVYQGLARLSDDAEWQWPVIYQIGLCFERMQLPGRAAEAYKFILEESQKRPKNAKPLPESVANLAPMARWRGEQLAWREAMTVELNHLLGAAVVSKPPAITAQR